MVLNTVDKVISLIRKSNHILVITGAGISVSCGIPDFRSKDIGIYNNLKCEDYNIPSAELLFDLEFFKIDPKPFYKFSSTLIPADNVKPSISHNFIYMLEQKKKLLRNYTQNIDGLERRVGISKLIECHGSMSKFQCIKCLKKTLLKDCIDQINKNDVCYCIKCGNLLKPMITFFGENIPNDFHKALLNDIPKCDLVIIIGTSLKVGGSVYKILQSLNVNIPQILINKDNISLPKELTKEFDAVLLGDCDIITTFISKSLGWTKIKCNSTRMKLNSEETKKKTKKRKRTQDDYERLSTKVFKFHDSIKV